MPLSQVLRSRLIMSEPEQSVERVVIDLTNLVEAMKGSIIVELKNRVYGLTIRALEQVILDLAKSELRKVVGEVLRGVLDDFRFRKILPKPDQKSVGEFGEVASELTLREYINVWLTEGNRFSYRNRTRISELLDNALEKYAKEVLQEVVTANEGQLLVDMKERVAGMVASKVLDKLR